MDLDSLKADTEIIISDWSQVVIVKRSSVSYDAAGMQTGQSWDTTQSFVGDWQPVSGATLRSEEGRRIRSVAHIIAPVDLDVTEDDQITIPDGRVFYVNYVRDYEDHTTVYLKRAVGQAEA